MKKTITALLVTAALAGSSGAMAQRWHGGQGNNNGGGNGGQNWSGQSGGNGGHSWLGQGGGNGGNGGNSGNSGHGRWSGGGGGSTGQSQFHTQSQSNGSGGHRWGGQGSSSFQGSANAQVQQNWQGGGNGGRSHWNGGGGWNGNDGGSARHYRQDRDGAWRNQGDNGRWRQRSGSWNNGGNWNNGHGRDDWRSWRNSNRDLFHLRRYEGPRGYSYRRFDRGYRIDPYFYAQQYWIDDPWQYRLPPADGPYRWVRYYNDALLVNIYTGEVEDVINDFFW